MRYRLGRHGEGKHRRLIVWLGATAVVAGLGWWGWLWLHHALEPKVSIKQAAPVTTQVSYSTTTKKYAEPDFTISLPATWKALPPQPGIYQTYTWQTSDSGTNGQQIEIYENTIPTNLAVNRALIVTGEVDHLALNGSASDNCSAFTGGTSTIPNEPGAPAKWQGVSFICDQRNQERDVIGTSSTDGVNTVILVSRDTGFKHKFFFTYTDYTLNPDYTVFYNALQSLHMN